MDAEAEVEGGVEMVQEQEEVVCLLAGAHLASELSDLQTRGDGIVPVRSVLGAHDGADILCHDGT